MNEALEILEQVMMEWEHRGGEFDRDVRAWTGKNSEGYRVMEMLKGELESE